METDLLKDIWNKARDSETESLTLSKEELTALVSGKTHDIYSEIQKTIWINFWIKTILTLASLGIVLFLPITGETYFLIGFVILCLVVLLIYDFKMMSKLKKSQIYTDSLSDHLLYLSKLMKAELSIYQIVAPFSNPLLVIIGITYYRLIKYQVFQLKDWDDMIVFGIVIFLSYLVAYVGSRRSLESINQNIQDFYSMLEEEEEPLQVLRKNIRAKKRNTITAVIVLGLGVILFLLLLGLYNVA